MPLEPPSHLEVLVPDDWREQSGAVVDDHMDVKVRPDASFDLPHEAEKLLVTVARQV